ncbi:MAG: tetratricopeptide repeat protein [Acidobacteria bacterium]|nr:tetratricopeptide repeat protein [Acidobacteriota bacterium]MBS1864897.1 tetratricopeptide repeat protein [Acidobacteriota bacterium]
MAYNDWVAQGSPCGKTGSGGAATPAAPALTPQQQLAMQSAVTGGYMIGQGLHQLLFGPPAARPAPEDPAQQQRRLAADQLNNSGIYLLKQRNYAGAIHEFQQALLNTPNDSVILHNLEFAEQKLRDGAVAAHTSGALGQLLGSTPSAGWAFNLNSPARTSVANPVASPLSLVNLDSDTRVVDLRGTSKTSLDAEALKGRSSVASPLVNLPEVRDIELLFPGGAPAESPSQVVLPQAKDIELLFPGPQPSGLVVPPQAQDIELLFQPPTQKKTPALPHN